MAKWRTFDISYNERCCDDMNRMVVEDIERSKNIGYG
jgi:hypothetical protein